VWEATKWCDALDSEIELGGCVVLDDLAIGRAGTLGDLVDLFVDLSTMMVTVLASTSHGELDTRWVPRTDTRDLAQTLVGLARKLGDAPACDNTLVALTLGDGDGVDHLILLKDAVHAHWLLEEALSEINLVGHGATIDLDLTKVGLLLAEVQLADLGVTEYTESGAVLGDLLFFSGDSITLGVLLRVTGEGLLVLGAAPVLVEAALALLTEMLSPACSEGLQATRGLVVANHATHNDGRGLEDGDSLDNPSCEPWIQPCRHHGECECSQPCIP